MRSFKFDTEFDLCCVKFSTVLGQSGGQISAINLNLPHSRQIAAAS
ncbi:hypothetical protein [Campylobacter rectus]|nr:hypothetical protein [Campylobacter rectus]